MGHGIINITYQLSLHQLWQRRLIFIQET
jgi:hypothetical protein